MTLEQVIPRSSDLYSFAKHLLASAAQVQILLPEDRVPWAGHTGRYAAKQVYQLIATHRLTIVFVNTRAQAEMTFRDLWNENDDALPIGIHHGSLAPEARHKVEAAMAEGNPASPFPAVTPSSNIQARHSPSPGSPPPSR